MGEGNLVYATPTVRRMLYALYRMHFVSTFLVCYLEAIALIGNNCFMYLRSNDGQIHGDFTHLRDTLKILNSILDAFLRLDR